MINRISIELETPGDSRSMFRLLLDDKAIAEGLTAAQAHVLVGEVLDRIARPRRAAYEPDAAEADELTAV